MKNKRQNKDKQNKSDENRRKDLDEKKGKDQHFFERWKDASHNKMGNDISGEIKIANSNGHLEGGKDKRWHMEGEE